MRIVIVAVLGAAIMTVLALTLSGPTWAMYAMAVFVGVAVAVIVDWVSKWRA